MATHKSAGKRAKQNETHRVQNANIRSGIKTKIKAVLSAIGIKNQEEAVKTLNSAAPSIAKAAAKGAFHKKTASRRISRLTKKVNSLQD